MTEREYIDATNLAKIRAIRSILRDALAMDATEKKCYQDAMAATYLWEAKLERVVICDTSTSKVDET